jgi:uncharacterized coiled-coil DUF342 family protein
MGRRAPGIAWSMSGLAVVVILIALGFLFAVGLVLYGRRRAAEQRLQRTRLETEIGGHRQEASAHASRADELRPQAQAHRDEAARHLEEAEELDQRATRSMRFAARHESQATERESRLEQL